VRANTALDERTHFTADCENITVEWWTQMEQHYEDLSGLCALTAVCYWTEIYGLLSINLTGCLFP